MRILAALCVFAVALAAQAPAPVRGTVLDENGAPLAGVTITLTPTPAAAPKLVLVTGANGEFSSPPLAGTTWRGTLEKPGFYTLDSGEQPTGITVKLRLHHAEEVRQQVEVTAPGNPIVATPTTPPQELGADEIRDVPTPGSHNLMQALPVLPAVETDNAGALHVAGARTGETQYQLDGFEFGDVGDAGFNARLAVDAVREVTVETGVSDAEAPHAGAGVVGLRSQSGDDIWRSGAVDFLPAPSLQEGLRLGNWYPRFTLSGPLRRGRAWFSEAVSALHTLSLVPSLPSNANTGNQWLGDSLTRLQLNLSGSNNLFVDALFNAADLGHSGLDPLNPAPTTTTQTSQRALFSALDQISWPGALLEFGGSTDFGHSSALPAGDALYVMSPEGDSGNYFQTLHGQDRRDQWLTRLWVPLRGWGSHEIETGGNLAALSLAQQAMRGPFEVVTATGAVEQQTSFTGPGRWRIHSQEEGGFIQDTWQLGRHWRLRPGLRVDGQSLTAGPVWQPRFSASFLPSSLW